MKIKFLVPYGTILKYFLIVYISKLQYSDICIFMRSQKMLLFLIILCYNTYVKK